MAILKKIWAVPFARGAPRQITDFNAGQINSFSRGEIRKDVVLMSGFR